MRSRSHGILPLSIVPVLVGRRRSTPSRLWKPDARAVRIKGAEHVATFEKTENKPTPILL